MIWGRMDLVVRRLGAGVGLSVRAAHDGGRFATNPLGYHTGSVWLHDTAVRRPLDSRSLRRRAAMAMRQHADLLEPALAGDTGPLGNGQARWARLLRDGTLGSM